MRAVGVEGDAGIAVKSDELGGSLYNGSSRNMNTVRRSYFWLLFGGFLLLLGEGFVTKGWWSKLFPAKHQNYKIVAKFESAQEGDKLILNELRKRGADFQKPREIVHYLYVPTQDASHEAAAKLRKYGFEVTERASADGANNPPNPWLVLARKVTLVDPQTVEEMRIQFEALASESKGEYDGWEAAAQP